jgi:hypothetical protein
MDEMRVESASDPFSGDSPVTIAVMANAGHQLSTARIEAADDFECDPIAGAGESERWHRLHSALIDLRDGFNFARELGRDVWDFAVEIETLQERGLRANELRWLIFKGWLAHGFEKSSRSSHHRSFVEAGPSWFDKTSCFTLTPRGAEILGRWPGGLLIPAPVEPAAQELIVPKWDRQRQELRLGQFLIKRFKVPANTQSMVLGTFEEEKWPPRIDDPLPGNPVQDRKRRLHNTINALNRNQIHPWIRFLGDGRGQGIRWELQTPASYQVPA